jgi:uncharacterized membrane protein YfcA
MSPADLAIIGLTVVVSSFISGTFGMAGGMVLLGVLLVYFDVTTAMVLFSIVQFFANGWRVALWWRFIKWPIFRWYMLGALIAAAALRAVAYVPDKALVYFLLGIMPFAVDLLPARARPNIEWRGVPFLTGILTTVVQIFAGVGGLFLDLFFQKSSLDRKTTIATKSPTQTFSHILRGAYFGSFGPVAGFGEPGALWLIAGAVVLAVIGVSLSPYVINRMTDDGFRRWVRAIIVVISVVYLARGAWLSVISNQ